MSGGHWVTIEDEHVYIGGGGKIEAGPANIEGKNIDHLPPRTKIGAADAAEHERAGTKHHIAAHNARKASNAEEAEKHAALAKSHFAEADRQNAGSPTKVEHHAPIEGATEMKPAAKAPAAKAKPTPASEKTSAKANAAPSRPELEKAVVDTMHNLHEKGTFKNKAGGGVPIHAVRAEIAKKFGSAAASHENLDEPILQAWRNGHAKIMPLSDMSDATPAQHEASIQDTYSTHFFMHPTRPEGGEPPFKTGGGLKAGPKATGKAPTDEELKSHILSKSAHNPQGNALVPVSDIRKHVAEKYGSQHAGPALDKQLNRIRGDEVSAATADQPSKIPADHLAGAMHTGAGERFEYMHRKNKLNLSRLSAPNAVDHPNTHNLSRSTPTLNLDRAELTGGHWVTIQGSDVYIHDGTGEIMAGADHLVGKNVKDLPARSKPMGESDHRAAASAHKQTSADEHAKAEKIASDKGSVAKENEHRANSASASAKAAEHEGHADKLHAANTGGKYTPASKSDPERNLKDARNVLRTTDQGSRIEIETANGQRHRVTGASMGRVTPDGKHILLHDGETEAPISSAAKIHVDGKEVWSKSESSIPATTTKTPTKSPPAMTSAHGKKVEAEMHSAGPVPIDQEVKAATESGKLQLPVGKDGKVDPHLEEAYRRHAAAQGHQVGAFDVDKKSGTATARVSKPEMTSAHAKEVEAKANPHAEESKAANKEYWDKFHEKGRSHPDTLAAKAKYEAVGAKYRNAEPPKATSATPRPSVEPVKPFTPKEAGKAPAKAAEPSPKVAPAATSAHGKAVEKIASKADLEKELIAHHESVGGKGTISHQDEQDLQAAAGAGDPFTFHKKLPTEIKSIMKDNGIKPGFFKVTNDAGKAGGADAFSQLGDRYERIAAAASGSQIKAAVKTAENSPDLAIRYKAAEYKTASDQPTPKSAAAMQGAANRAKAALKNVTPEHRAKAEANVQAMQDRAQHAKQAAVGKEHVQPEHLQQGDTFRVNGHPVTVTVDEDGEEILKDHGSLPDTPLAALHGSKLAVDHGSLKHEDAGEEHSGTGFEFGENAKHLSRLPIPTLPERRSRQLMTV